MFVWGVLLFLLGPSRDRNRLERERVTQSFNLFFGAFLATTRVFWEVVVVVVVVAASCPERFTKIFNFTFLANRELLLLLLLFLLLLVIFCLLLSVVVVGGGGGGSGDGCCCGIPSLQCFLNSFE